MSDVCIVCGGEIEAMPDVDDPRFTADTRAPWWFVTTAQGTAYHVRCEGGMQLEFAA